MNTSKDFINQLVASIKENKDNLAEITTDLVTIATDDELLRNVPLVKWAVTILKLHDSYRQAKLKRNIAKFLKTIETGNYKNVEIFLREIENDKNKYEDLAITIMDILFESSRAEIASIYARLLVAAANRLISYDDFETLSLIIASSSPTAVLHVPKYFEEARKYLRRRATSEAPEAPNAAFLVGMGLMNMNRMPQSPTDLATKLYLYGFKGEEEIADTVSHWTEKI